MLIRVRVFANARKELVFKKSGDRFEVWVKAKPLRQEANQEAIRVLAEYFNVLESEVKLIRGHHRANKLFEINDQLF